jgi:Zn-dependent peptidase ImmA (M78 family)/transcriptional regulator with XRE-family HTH domain
MARTLSGANPKILKWAREMSGYSLAQVADALKKDPAIIMAWESGKDSPTYVQLEKLAYQLYKRPIALFFFPEPPEENEPSKAFRTLPDFERQALSTDTRYAIRQAKAMQLVLYELIGVKNDSDNIIFKDVRINERNSISAACDKARDYLGITLKDQFEWKDSTEALKKWRDVIQDAGIFVFKRSLKQREVSGFSLIDAEFPVIYLNNSTPHTRQVFSLIHELAHILLGENGITKLDEDYIDRLSGRNKQVEVFCNRFAAEFLIPKQDFLRYSNADFYDEAFVEKLANKFKVSREVILRRALDSRLVDSDYYLSKAYFWIGQAESARKSAKGGGGDYYATQATYLGSKFINLAFRQYHSGRFSREQLADYLNVKVKNLDRFEPLAIGGM